MTRKPLTDAQREAARRRQQAYMNRHPGRSAALKKQRRLRPGVKEEQKRQWEKKYYSTPAEERRWAYILKQYGVTREQFELLLTQQGNQCACCGVEDPGKRGWQLDHCHAKLNVRGVLCFRCNTGLGLANDSPEILRRWIKYLRR